MSQKHEENGDNMSNLSSFFMWYHMKYGLPWSPETNTWRTCQLHVSKWCVGSARRATFTWNSLLAWVTLGPHKNNVDITFCGGWHVDLIKKWCGHCILCGMTRGPYRNEHCILWKCNCNCCFGWCPVGRENVMEDNMFIPHIKICDIVVLGVVFEAILCDGKLWFPSSSPPRQVSMVSWTKDNMSGDSFFMTISRQYACERWHALALSRTHTLTYGTRYWCEGGWHSRWAWAYT